MAKADCEEVSISVIIPTLNEAENIGILISHLCAFRSRSLAAEVIVVDDLSTDGTQDKVNAFCATNPVRLLERSSPKNGLAGAVLAGAQLATHDIVVVMDADFSHPPDSVPALIAPLLANEADLVVGSRYAAGGSTPGWPLMRRIASRMACLIVWPVTGVHDSMSGFFAVRRERLVNTPADAAGFKILLELLIRGRGKIVVREIPIAFVDRERGTSKMNGAVIWIYLRRILKLMPLAYSRAGAAD